MHLGSSTVAWRILGNLIRGRERPVASSPADEKDRQVPSHISQTLVEVGIGLTFPSSRCSGKLSYRCGKRSSLVVFPPPPIECVGERIVPARRLRGLLFLFFSLRCPGSSPPLRPGPSRAGRARLIFRGRRRNKPSAVFGAIRSRPRFPFPPSRRVLEKEKEGREENTNALRPKERERTCCEEETERAKGEYLRKHSIFFPPPSSIGGKHAPSSPPPPPP